MTVFGYILCLVMFFVAASMILDYLSKQVKPSGGMGTTSVDAMQDKITCGGNIMKAYVDHRCIYFPIIVVTTLNLETIRRSY